ncbi:MAG: ATP synthase subunit I [Desulfatibacillum sp.]|nr:ATP synthase subunit I [Desulfatibacillum sp.]
MIPEVLGYFFAAFAWGVALGLVFFWGLWITVRHVVSSPKPKAWLTFSMLLRFTLLLAGFYGVARLFPPGIIPAMAGVLAARAYVSRKTRKTGEAP